MRLTRCHANLLACSAILILHGPQAAAAERPGIRLEAPKQAHPGDVIAVTIVPTGSLKTDELRMVMVFNDCAEETQVLVDHFQQEFSFTIRKDAIGWVRFSAMVSD